MDITDKNMKFKEWYDAVRPSVDERTAESVWESCKQECLKILKRPIQNCDLSWEETDKRFIDRIEKDV